MKKRKLPKQVYVQSYKDGDDSYYVVRATTPEVVEDARNLEVDSYVGVYELKEMRRIVDKPELVKIK